MELFQLMGTIAIDNAKATQALDKTIQKGAETKQRLNSSLSDAGKNAGDSLKQVGDTAGTSFDKVGDAAQNAADDVTEAAVDVADAAKDAAGDAADAAQEAGETARHESDETRQNQEENQQQTNEGLERTRKIALEVSKGIGNAFTSIGTKITNFVTKPAILAGTALAGMVIHKGWSRMTQIDEAKAKLSGLGHSAKEVSVIMDNALASVKGTSFGMSEAATTAASAVAAGIKPGQELQRYLTLVGDAATIAGTDMGEMGSIFNKVAANGKISAEEMNQLADRGIPIWQLLADSTGKSMDQVRKDVSAGNIKIKEFQNAIEKGMGGAAQNGGKTVTGAMKNVGAALGRVGANFLGASDDAGTFSSQLVDVLNDVKNWLGDVEEKAKGFGKTFGNAFGTAIKIFKAMPNSVKLTSAAIAVMTGPTLKLVGAVIRARVAMKEFMAAEEGLSIVQGIFTGKITASNVVLNGLWGKLTSLATAISPMALTFTGAAVAAGGLALALYKVYQKSHEATIAAKDMVQAHSQNVVSTKQQAEAQAKSADLQYERLDHLMQKEKKSANDKKLIKTYVDKLNESVHGLNLKYDEEADKLNKTSDAIRKKIEAQKEEAVYNAYAKNYQESLNAYADGAVKLADAEEKLKQKEKEVEEARKNGKSSEVMQRDLLNCKQKVDDLKSAQNSYAQDVQKQSNAMQIASGAWDSLVKKAGLSGKNISSSLISGIQNGTYKIPETVGQLNALIKFDKAAENATGSAQKTVKKLKEGLASGDITVKEATAKLNKAMQKEMEKAPSKAKSEGKKSGKGYASGYKSAKGAAKSSAQSVANSAKSGANGVKMDAIGKKKGKDLASGYKSANSDNKKAGKGAAEAGKKGAEGVKTKSVGKNLALGIADGIDENTSFVEAAARRSVRKAKDAANKEADSHSPSRVFRDEVGAYLAQGIAVGMLQEIPTIESASQEMIKAAKVKATYSVEGETDETGISLNSSWNPSSSDERQTNLLNKILVSLEQLNMTIVNQKILWNDRELGRMVRNYAR